MGISIELPLTLEVDPLILNDIYFGKKYSLKLVERVVLFEQEDPYEYNIVYNYKGEFGLVYYNQTDMGTSFYEEEILVKWRGNYHHLIYTCGSGLPDPLPRKYKIFLSSINKEIFNQRKKMILQEQE